MILVLDTNVLVSALLSPFGAPARVLDLVLAAEIGIAADDRLLAEYREVLMRPRFAFDPADVGALLSFLAASATHVSAPPLPVELPDPDDAMFLEVAAATGATLISGNLRHFPSEQRAGVVVVSPAEFLAGWRG